MTTVDSPPDGQPSDTDGDPGRDPAFGLRPAVITDIEQLADQRHPAAAITSGRLEQLLRLAPARHTTTGDGHAAVPAIRAACAHLAGRRT